MNALHRLAAAAALALPTMACGKSTPPTASPPSATPSTTAAAPSAAPSTASRAAPRDVDLLTWTDAKVTVSSKVDNPHDFPEHLADGDRETAWNGKTGDLHPTIVVALPAGATAKSLGIIVGYDRKKTNKSGKEEDLFLMNHRVKKIRIVPASGDSKTFDLDVNKREMQRVSIELSGTFTIEIVESVPGTEASWKEIVLSELRVFGTAGAAARSAPRTPDVALAAAPSSAAAAVTGAAGKDYAAWCKSWKDKVVPLLHDMYDVGGNYPGHVDPPDCARPPTVLPAPALPGGLEGAMTFTRVNVEDAEDVVAFTTPEGLAVPLVLLGRSHGDPGCGGYALVRDVAVAATAEGALVSWIVGDLTNPMPDDQGILQGGSAAAMTHAALCARAAGKVTCSPTATFARVEGTGPLEPLLASYRKPALAVRDGKVVAGP